MLFILQLIAKQEEANLPWWAYVFPIITALIAGGLVNLYKARAEKDSIAAAAAKTAVDIFEASINLLQSDLAISRAEVLTAHTEIQKLRLRCENLELQLIDLKHMLHVPQRRIGDRRVMTGEEYQAPDEDTK